MLPPQCLASLLAAALLTLGLSACGNNSQAQIPMANIPSGSFNMGCLSDNDCLWMEHPAHEVHIRAFKMAKTETTWAQYQPCIDAGACKAPPEDGGFGRNNRPVIFVNQNDITAYIQWLNKTTGKQYRLPSEAEWEYAARAGSNTKFSWGNSTNCDKALYASINNANCTPTLGSSTAPVGSYTANAFGLYDMHGNVRELVADCWNNSYAEAPLNGEAWMEGKCYKAVLRGGAWSLDSKHLRAAYRHRGLALARENLSGFRLAHNLISPNE